MRVRRHPSVCKKAGIREEHAETEIDAAQGCASADVVQLLILFYLFLN